MQNGQRVLMKNNYWMSTPNKVNSPQQKGISELR